MERENDIVKDAYYLINKFNNNDQEVTNLQIQKLMYFFEAYYMNVYEDKEKLYDCNFSAWALGPVAIPLYKEFRKFGNNPIKLSEDDKKQGNSISASKKRLLDAIYEAFKKKTANNLVSYTHMKDSPWDIVWERNGGKVGYGADTYIDKQQTKEWFKNNFIEKQ